MKNQPLSVTRVLTFSYYAVFVFVFIPETKGKSLEEVEKWFEYNKVSIFASCRSEDDVVVV